MWTSIPTRWTATQPVWTRVVSHATNVDTQRNGWTLTQLTWTANSVRFGCPHNGSWAAKTHALGNHNVWPRHRIGLPRKRGHAGMLGIHEEGGSFRGLPHFRLGQTWGYVANLTRLVGNQNWPRYLCGCAHYRHGNALHVSGVARCM